MTELFKNRTFMIFYVGQSISRMGDSFSVLAMAWLAHVLTNSTLFMSAILAMAIIPRVLIAPISGVFVERWNKRICMICADCVRCTSLAILVLLLVTHTLAPWMLFLFSFVLSTMSTIATPANIVVQKLIIPKDQLLKANALNQTTTNVMFIVGPATAGYLIGIFGIPIAFGVDSVTFLVSVISLFMIFPHEPARAKKPLTRQSVLGDMVEGAKIFWNFPSIRALAPYMMLYTFFVAALENLLIVQFVANYLHVEKATIAVGNMNGSMAVGEVIGSLLVVYMTSKFPAAKMQMTCLVISSAMVLLSGLSHSVLLICACFFIAGVVMNLSNVSYFSSIQRDVPTESLSRIWSIMGAAFNAVLPAGQLVFGGIASFVPVQYVIPAMGAIALLVSCGAFITPSFRAYSMKQSSQMRAQAAQTT